MWTRTSKGIMFIEHVQNEQGLILPKTLVENIKNSTPLKGVEYDILIKTLYKQSTSEPKIKGML